MTMRGLHHAARLCARLCDGVAAAFLLAITALLLADVVARACGHPLFGAQDLAEMALVLVTFGAVTALEQRDAQIRVDLLKPAMPHWLVTGGDRIAALLGAGLYLALAKALWDSAALSALLNLSSNILNLPKAPVQYAVAGLVTMAAAISALRALDLAGKGTP